MKITTKVAGLAFGLLLLLLVVQSYFTFNLYNKVSALESHSSNRSQGLALSNSQSRAKAPDYGSRQFSLFSDFFEHFDNNFGRNFGQEATEFDPFAEMETLQNDFSKFFQNPLNSDPAFDPFNGSLSDTNSMSPKIEFVQKPDRYVVSVSIPGANNASLKSSIEKDHLLIEGEVKIHEENSSNSGTSISSESYSTSFKRVISIPDDVDKGRISQKHEDGKLKIVMPKL